MKTADELMELPISKKNYVSYFKIAKKEGYTSLSEAIIDKYFNHQMSAIQISKWIGSSYYGWIYKFFEKKGYARRIRGVHTKDIDINDPYKVMDSKLNLKENSKREKRINKYNYNTFSEAIIDLYYYKGLTMTKIGEMLNVSSTNVLKSLNKINNNQPPFNKISDKELEEILNSFSKENTLKNWLNYLSNKKIKLSPSKIKKLINLIKLIRKKECQLTQASHSHSKTTEMLSETQGKNSSPIA